MSTDAIRFFAATDVGNVREHNEDNFLVDKKLSLFMVADGMGGHAAGEVASAIAVRTIHEEIKRERELLTDFVNGARGASRVTNKDILALMEHAVQRACSRIHEEAEIDSAKRGMGTTLSALLILGTRGFIAHVGDSRIYLGRAGTVQQITEDHTVFNELVKRGKLTKEQIEKVGHKNAITRAVGVYERVDVDTLMLEVLPGDDFLLTSDGLTGYLENADELAPWFAQDGDAASKGLVELAKERGGKDNITVVIVRLVGDASSTTDDRAKRLALKRETLARMPLFSRLSDRELLRVMQAIEVRKYEPEQVVVREGDKGDELFIVLSGKVKVARGGETLTRLGAGEHFGGDGAHPPGPPLGDGHRRWPCGAHRDSPRRLLRASPHRARDRGEDALAVPRRPRRPPRRHVERASSREAGAERRGAPHRGRHRGNLPRPRRWRRRPLRPPLTIERDPRTTVERPNRHGARSAKSRDESERGEASGATPSARPSPARPTASATSSDPRIGGLGGLAGSSRHLSAAYAARLPPNRGPNRARSRAVARRAHGEGG